MFGYRLVRERDYDAIVTERAALLEKVAGLQDRIIAEIRAAADMKAEVRSKSTMIDLLTRDLRLAEERAAQYAFAKTGVPQPTAAIVSGPPLRTEMMAEGGALFEDVGDENAERLRQAGALHETDPEVPFMNDGLGGPTH